MKKFSYLRTPNYRTFLLPNGKMVDVYEVLYSSKVDLEKGMYIPTTSENFEKSSLPTFSELVIDNIVKEISCIEYFDIDFDYKVKSLTIKDMLDVQKKFKENGYNVSLKAIKHNYDCWLCDFKSGYRGKGYHLFTPCGCNPLSFRATTLHRKCKDWQTTYYG
jgi:hypothetical protein